MSARIEAARQEWLKENYQPDPWARDAALMGFHAGAVWMREQIIKRISDRAKRVMSEPSKESAVTELALLVADLVPFGTEIEPAPTESAGGS